MRVGLSDFVADQTAIPLNTPSDLVQISSKAYAETGFSPVPECRVLGTDETRARWFGQCAYINGSDNSKLWITDSFSVCAGEEDSRLRFRE